MVCRVELCTICDVIAGGGLWVFGENGLTRVDTNRSISVFDHENGLPKNNIAATIRFGGSLYALTGSRSLPFGVWREMGWPLHNFAKSRAVTDWLFTRGWRHRLMVWF